MQVKNPLVEQLLAEHDEEAAEWLFVVQTTDDLATLESLGFDAVLGGHRDRAKGMAQSFSAVVLCDGVFDEDDELRSRAESLLRLDKSPAIALGYPSPQGQRWDDERIASIRRTWLHLCRDVIGELEFEQAENPEKFTPFPLHVLPPACRQFVQECAAAQSVDPAFVGVPLLAVLGGSIGISRRVQAKDGWVEPPIIWAATVAPSGSGKSPPLRQLLKPIFARDYCVGSKVGSVVEGARNNSKEPHQDVLVSDVTSEGLAVACHDNPRGLLLFRDELAGWVQSFNKYRSGDDAQQWLELWAANPLKITRKTQSPIVVESPAVSVVGTIQPAVARRCFGSREARESGLTARLLFVQPPISMACWTTKTVSVEARRAYENVVNTLLDLNLESEGLRSRILSFSSEGAALFADFHNRSSVRQLQAHERGDLDAYAMTAKARSYAIRLALIVALAKAADEGQAESLAVVDEEAVEAGITLASWFEREACRLNRSWGQRDAEHDETLDRKVLGIINKGDVTRSELSNGLDRNYTSVQISQSLERLSGKGQAERKDVAHEGPGRRLEVWGVIRAHRRDSA